MISIRHLRKSFDGIEVLTDVNAEIERGEVVAIIGPSGAGKSTFLRCLNRLEMPDGGTVVVDGVDVTAPEADLAVVRRRMGMVFQSFNLFGNLDVLGNIVAAQRDILRVSKNDANHKALELLGRVGLSDKSAALPDELSGGQKQRVAIARALAMDPAILLFDEPTSALDPTMIGEVLAVIKNLARSGMTMLIVTHEMGFAREVANRILYLDEGVVYESGTPSEIFSRPQRPKTAEFVGRVLLKQALDMMRLLREGILMDGRVDEFEAQMLLRLVEPFERFGGGQVKHMVELLRQLLADKVISKDESRRIAALLEKI